MLVCKAKSGEYKEIIEECNESIKTNTRDIKISKEKQMELSKSVLRDGALNLWHILQESELTYNDYEEIREYIVNLFLEDK